MKAIQSEGEYLVHLLYCAVHKTAPEPIPDGLSWENVFDCAVRHEVTAFAFTAVQRLAQKPEPQLLSRWQEKYYQSITRSTTQMRARDQIVAAFRAHGICTMEVQGTVVKRYYPAENLRMMSDIDLIIPPDKLTEASDILREMGYAVEEVFGSEVDAQKGLVFVEVHTSFFSKDKEEFASMREPFSYVTVREDCTVEVPDTVFYLYNMLHCLKHYRYQGMGISRVLDIYYLKKALQDTVDSASIDALLTQYDLKNDLLDLYALADFWFDGIEPQRELSDVAEEILSANRHGTAELELVHQLRRGKEKNGRFVRLRNFCRRIFPTKEYMYFGYPFCARHKLPIVLCWFYRVFSILFSVRKLRRFAAYLRQLAKSK